MGAIKIYVLTMGDELRMQSVRDQLENVDFEFFYAVRTTLVDAVNSENFDYNEYRTTNKNFLPDNAVGCTLSHNQIYQDIVAKNFTGAVILEDDFLIRYKISEIYPLLSEFNLDQIGVCILGYSKLNLFDLFNYNLSNPFVSSRQFYKQFKIRRRSFHTSCGAVGYYISKNAADFVLQSGTPYYAADEWPIISSMGFNVEYLWPTIVSEGQNFDSSIENQRNIKNRKLKNTISKIFLDVLKIPIRFVKGRFIKWQNY
jgi:beta-1,4-galactosyltransferase